MKIKKNILFIALSILLMSVILIIGIFKYVNYWYKKIDALLTEISESNDFLYYNDEHFYYNGNSYSFYRFFEDIDYRRDIVYISNDYLIYSEYNDNKKYDYYLIDYNGNVSLLYSSEKGGLCAFIDNTIYIKRKVGNSYYYGLYNVGSQVEEELTIEEFYLKVYDSKYTVAYDNGYIVTDTSTGLSKRISIKNLLNNEVILELHNAKKKLFLSDLIIENVMVSKNEVFVLISTDGIEGLTIRYDFDSAVSEVIDKFGWEYLEPYVIISSLNNDVCKPLEYLLKIGQK